MNTIPIVNENETISGLRHCLDFMINYNKSEKSSSSEIISVLEKTVLAEKNGDYGYELSEGEKSIVSIIEEINESFKSGSDLSRPFEICAKTLMTFRMKKALDEINETLITNTGKSGLSYSFSNNDFSEEQNTAVKNALENRISIITGGPGTGKTSVIEKIVNGFIQLGGTAKKNIAVCAPTGKAANRIGEILHNYPDITPQTVHRLCGYSPSGGYFFYNHENRLPYDIVIVDEASMLDLYAARQLIVSLKPESILVLAGDSFQLPPVGSGRFFNDLVEFSDCHDIPVSKLSKNFRTEGVSLGKFVEKCRNSDFTPSETFEDVIFKPLTPENLKSVLKYEIVPVWREPINIPDDFKLRDQNYLNEWKSMNSKIILTPVNQGPHGTEEINGRISSELGDFFAGMRIIMNKNNYIWNIYNGDIGVVVSGFYQNNESLWAAFPESDFLRLIPLREISTSVSGAHAVTVHRSQGSEFKEVTMLLPPNAPNLSPQLIYTGISRARNKVTVYGDINQFAAILKSRQKRRTSLFSFSKSNCEKENTQ